MTEPRSHLPDWMLRAGSAADGEVELLGSEIAYENQWVLVVHDRVRLPAGGEGHYTRVVERASLTGEPGVVLIPEFEGSVYFVEIYRHALRAWSLEVPRGMRSPGQTVQDAIAAELREEIGGVADDVVALGSVAPNSALLTNAVPVYWVRLAGPPPGPIEPAHEGIRSVVAIPAGALDERIAAGDVVDGFTLSGLQLARSQGLLGS